MRLGPPSVPGPRSARRSQSWSATIQESKPVSTLTCTTTSIPQVSGASGEVGCVPAMNHSLTVVLPEEGAPVHGSILTRTSPSDGALKFVIGQLAVASFMNPCQT